MNVLGVYFGPEIISIVETKGRNLTNNIQIPQNAFAPGGLEEKVPTEIKMVALFKDELRKNNIQAEGVNLALSGKDLIIRTFEMPLIPRGDLARAINFEARKYIPFKVEELVLDYQLYFDRPSKKNLVLLVGIKKESLDKYLAVFKQLNLKIISIEYAAFSILRLVRPKDKGIIGVVDADLRELDEVNFTVLENGFPLFSRDIILSGSPQGPMPIKTEEITSGMILEKLKTEIRVSLDYYQRKFPNQKLKKIFFISGKDYQPDLEIFAKDIGLDSHFIDVDKFIGKAVPFSLSFIKGYSSSLSKVIKILPKIDLISAKTRQTKEITPSAQLAIPIFKGLRIQPLMFILAISLCIVTFLLGFYQKLPLQKELKGIRDMRPQVSLVNPETTYEELTSKTLEYKRKSDALDNLVKKQLYFTSLLNVIPVAIPKEVWLERLTLRKEEDKTELILEGMAYSADSDKEFEMVNKFLSNLKEDAEFSKNFKEINITSLDHARFENLTVTNFSISCKNY